jgi:type II secretory ATPase GspE/PulE/Tfp pilus assembly ATPase PilB-like protein
MHAQSALEAASRLRGFGVDSMDLRSIDCLVVQRRMLEYEPKTRKSSEIRRVVEIAEIGDSVNRLFCHKEKTDIQNSLLFGKVCENFKMTSKEGLAELKRREKLIKSADDDFTSFVTMMQKELHGIEDESD